ncbi:ComEC/Rec2 family competence protein [Hyphomonas sp.]|uniref:ComEC/Rec2 family competence protein n=1 Tax=Hyphomonas sp. TaxID=87 RepID=UPI00391CA7EB
MQGGGRPGSRILRGAASLVGIDGRLLVLAFAVCGGAAVYFSLPSEPRFAVLSGAAALLFGLWMMARRWWTSDLAITAVLIAFGLVLGAAAGSARARFVTAPVVGTETGPVMLEGWVQEIEPGRRGVRLLIRVHSIAGLSDVEWPEFVRVTHMSRLEVAPGRFVRCWSVLRPPPSPAMPGEYDFRRQAWFEQLGAVGYVQGRCRGGVLGAPHSGMQQLHLQLGAIRRNLAVRVNDAAGLRAGGFAAALVSGDRSFMKAEDAEALRATGLAHLLAISGLHLSIVGGLVFLLVKRALILIEPLALRIAVQKPAAITALIACLVYLVISGASVSTQRAFIMAAIVFGAVIFDRAAISLRTFAIAMVAVVLLQPESVVTPGFQMSFAATGALIAAYEIWRDHRSGREEVLGPIAFSWVSIAVTSVVAGLATMPFALFHFDRASPIGFAANLAAMPVVTFVSAPSAALAFLLAPFGLADIGLRLFGYSLEIVLAVAHFFARFSGEVAGSGRPMPVVSLVLATLALGSFISLSGPLRAAAGIALTVAAIGVWMSAPHFVAHWSASGDVYVSAASGKVERLNLEKGNGLSPMRYSEVAASECTEPICAVDTGLGPVITVLRSDPPEVCFEAPASTGSASRTCWTWESVQQTGGKTLYRDGAALVEVIPEPCGARLWTACPP